MMHRDITRVHTIRTIEIAPWPVTDLDYRGTEIWHSVTNDRHTAVLLQGLHSRSFQVTRTGFYWVRTVLDPDRFMAGRTDYQEYCYPGASDDGLWIDVSEGIQVLFTFLPG
jgi:hypothetical protein